MKLGLLGDTHFTNKAPERRLDNYFEIQMNKLAQAFDIFKTHKCDCIIQVGDFFDSPYVSNRVEATIIEFLIGHLADKPIYCIFGQHDISGHSVSTLLNSPLAVLESSRVVKILNDKASYSKWFRIKGFMTCVRIYGASFGEVVPVPENPNDYNILVIHKMIGDRPLYPGQELIQPRQFLRNNPDYQLVVCGDYHYRFIDTYQDRTIINPGAMVRKTISKFDLEHKPAVVIFDTDTSKVEVIELVVEPVEKVFDLKRIEKSDNQVLVNFVEKIRESKGKERAGWKEILLKVLEERKSSAEVKAVIDSCLDEIKEDKK